MGKLWAIIKIFITHLSRFGAIIKFWDKIYTPVTFDVDHLEIPKVRFDSYG